MSDHFLNLQPGTIVNGRYEVVRCLGTGSMGMVYACRHRELSGHIVAMKVLFSEVARDETAAARFRNEIVASYNVNHPNVVRAYEYFRDGDLVAFSMEYIGGGDLADRISSDEEIPIDEVVHMLCQMASGVQAIHDAGIIHRDLKPENILLTAQGDIKITDFGIARMGSGPKLTEHGGVVGTLDYVSPEYLERGHVDARSDIYALGVLAYEMITGDSPFKGKSVIENITQRLKTDPEPPHHLRPDCPVPLSNIVLRAMSRDPDQRYQIAREMLEDLEAIIYSRKSSGASSSGGLPAAVRIPESWKNQAHAQGRAAAVLAERDEVHAQVAGMGGTSYVAFAKTEVEDDRSDTLKLRANSVVELTEGADYLGLGGYESEETLESVLSPDYDVQSSGDARPEPSVNVSSSSLSAERVKELNANLWSPRRDLFKYLLHGALVAALGFVLGTVALRLFWPELFTELNSRPQPTYVD